MNDVFTAGYLFVLARRASFFWHQKKQKCRLKIFVLKFLQRLEKYSPKNLLGRFKVERRNSTLALKTAKTSQA